MWAWLPWNSNNWNQNFLFPASHIFKLISHISLLSVPYYPPWRVIWDKFQKQETPIIYVFSVDISIFLFFFSLLMSIDIFSLIYYNLYEELRECTNKVPILHVLPLYNYWFYKLSLSKQILTRISLHPLSTELFNWNFHSLTSDWKCMWFVKLKPFNNWL